MSKWCCCNSSDNCSNVQERAYKLLRLGVDVPAAGHFWVFVSENFQESNHGLEASNGSSVKSILRVGHGNNTADKKDSPIGEYWRVARSTDHFCDCQNSRNGMFEDAIQDLKAEKYFVDLIH